MYYCPFTLSILQGDTKSGNVFSTDTDRKVTECKSDICVSIGIWLVCKTRSMVSSVKMGKIPSTYCENAGNPRVASACGSGNSVWSLLTKHSNPCSRQIKG